MAKNIIKIGRDYIFESAHHIPGHESCGKVHGHTYTVTVTLTGHKPEDQPFLMDFHTLNNTVRTILKYVDHQDLNEVLDFIPSVENLAIWLSQALLTTKLFNDMMLISVKIQEGDGGFAEVQLQNGAA